MVSALRRLQSPSFSVTVLSGSSPVIFKIVINHICGVVWYHCQGIAGFVGQPRTVEVEFQVDGFLGGACAVQQHALGQSSAGNGFLREYLTAAGAAAGAATRVRRLVRQLP